MPAQPTYDEPEVDLQTTSAFGARLRTAAAMADIGAAVASTAVGGLLRRLPAPLRTASARASFLVAGVTAKLPGLGVVSRAATRCGDASLPEQAASVHPFPDRSAASDGSLVDPLGQDLVPAVDPDATAAVAAEDAAAYADLLAAVEQDAVDARPATSELTVASHGAFGVVEEPGTATRAAEPASTVGDQPGATLGQDELPLPDYDHLTLPQLRARLRRLEAPALAELRDYERAHGDRLPVVTMLDNRLAKLAADADENHPVRFDS